MFQFTTTTIINSEKDFTSKVPLYSGQAADAGKKIPASFEVKRVNKFLVTNIQAVYKKAAVGAEFATATVDLSKCAEILAANKAKKGTFRIEIYVNLTQSNNNPYYANDFDVKGMPFTIEFSVKEGEDAQALVKKVIKIINKFELFKHDYTTITSSADDTKLKLVAVDPYQVFTKVELQYFDPTLGQERGCCQPRGEYAPATDYVDNDVVTIKAGNEGFGTTEWIMRNLRLPSIESTRWTAPYQDERPIPGVNYNQYTLHYCVNRGILGGDAVGEVVHSLTTHVFYVASTLADKFEAAMTSAGITITPYTDEVSESDGDVKKIEATANAAKTVADSAKAEADKTGTEVAALKTKVDAKADKTYVDTELAKKQDK